MTISAKTWAPDRRPRIRRLRHPGIGAEPAAWAIGAKAALSVSVARDSAAVTDPLGG